VRRRAEAGQKQGRSRAEAGQKQGRSRAEAGQKPQEVSSEMPARSNDLLRVSGVGLPQEVVRLPQKVVRLLKIMRLLFSWRI